MEGGGGLEELSREKVSKGAEAEDLHQPVCKALFCCLLAGHHVLNFYFSGSHSPVIIKYVNILIVNNLICIYIIIYSYIHEHR